MDTEHLPTLVRPTGLRQPHLRWTGLVPPEQEGIACQWECWPCSFYFSLGMGWLRKMPRLLHAGIAACPIRKERASRGQLGPCMVLRSSNSILSKVNDHPHPQAHVDVRTHAQTPDAHTHLDTSADCSSAEGNTDRFARANQLPQ